MKEKDNAITSAHITFKYKYSWNMNLCYTKHVVYISKTIISKLGKKLQG